MPGPMGCGKVRSGGSSPMNLSTAAKSESFVARELLSRFPQQREHDGHQVVRAEMLLDEPACGSSGASCPIGSGTPSSRIIDVDTSIETAFVAPNVRLNRDHVAKPGGMRQFDGDIDQRERGDRLRLAILEDLKVLLRQIPDKIPALVRHPNIHLDIFDLHRERGCRGLKRYKRLACRLLSRRGGEKQEGDDDSREDSTTHLATSGSTSSYHRSGLTAPAAFSATSSSGRSARRATPRRGRSGQGTRTRGLGRAPRPTSTRGSLADA